MGFNSIRGEALWSHDKDHCGAVPERLHKHVAKATGIEEHEAHEAIVLGDSLLSPTQYFTLL